MSTLQPSPTAQHPFVPGALVLTDLDRAASGVSPYAPHASAAPTASLEMALAAAQTLCAQRQGSVPVLYTERLSAVAGRTSTTGSPLRSHPTNLRSASGKPIAMCIVS